MLEPELPICIWDCSDLCAYDSVEQANYELEVPHVLDGCYEAFDRLGRHLLFEVTEEKSRGWRFSSRRQRFSFRVDPDQSAWYGEQERRLRSYLGDDDGLHDLQSKSVEELLALARRYDATIYAWIEGNLIIFSNHEIASAEMEFQDVLAGQYIAFDRLGRHLTIEVHPGVSRRWIFKFPVQVVSFRVDPDQSAWEGEFERRLREYLARDYNRKDLESKTYDELLELAYVSGETK